MNSLPRVSIILFFAFICCSFVIPAADDGERYFSQNEALRAYADGDYHFTRRDYENALKMYHKAESLGVTHPYLVFKKGLSYFEGNEYKLAIVNLTRSINLMAPNQNLTDYISDLEYRLVRMGDDYIPMKYGVTLEYTYVDAYYYRGLAKYFNGDEFGAVVDFRKFHSIGKDSTISSCYYLAVSLIGAREVSTATKYFDYVINNADALTFPFFVGDSYYMRGLMNYNANRKADACRDWSKASELGIEEAFDKISKYCQDE